MSRRRAAQRDHHWVQSDLPDIASPRGATGGPCPGWCNKPWREAELLREDKGVEHGLLPDLGAPVWCGRCREETRLALKDLPGLYDAIHVEAIQGTPPEVERKASGDAPAWPGKTAMLMLDYIVEGVRDLEWDLTEHHPLMDGVVPLRGRERPDFFAACAVLGEHLDWLLAKHGEAADPDTSPRAMIMHLHRAGSGFCARNPPPREVLHLPCPGCGHKALTRLVGPTKRQEYCRCELCGQVLEEAEYRSLVAWEAGHIKARLRREERRKAREAATRGE